MRVALRFVSRHKDAVTVFLQENRAVRGPRWHELVAKRDAYERMVQDIIADGIESGRFVDIPPTIASKAILAMANWGYTWFDSAGPLSADEIADIFGTIALSGLETR